MKINKIRLISTGIIFLSSILFILFFMFTDDIMKIQAIECQQVCGVNMPEECPHAQNIPLISYIGFTISFLILLAGIYLWINFGKIIGKENKTSKIVIKSLGEDEKKVFEIIANSGGAVFQSELVEKTGFSKAKVSRILDKLEVKNLVERRRRGMTNMVVIKRNG